MKKQRHFFANKGPSSQGYVFPVVMFECESWTRKKAECQKIDAFELWCWRRLSRVPWTARRSNRSILKEISEKIGWPKEKIFSKWDKTRWVCKQWEENVFFCQKYFILQDFPGDPVAGGTGLISAGEVHMPQVAAPKKSSSGLHADTFKWWKGKTKPASLNFSFWVSQVGQSNKSCFLHFSYVST